VQVKAAVVARVAAAKAAGAVDMVRATAEDGQAARQEIHREAEDQTRLVGANNSAKINRK